VLLPLALYCVRETPDTLGRQFTLYLNEEFFQDAERLAHSGTSWREFLAHYVEVMPQLSLHGRHFPPGHASLLYGIAQLFGPSVQAAGYSVLAIVAGGVVCAFLALRRIAGEQAARQGACLLLAVPSLLDFACVSMDAVFFAIAALAWWLALRALAPQARAPQSHAPWARTVDACIAGIALLAATFFSFSTLPLGLAIALCALIAGRAEILGTLRQLAILGAAYAASALLLYGISGFAIWRCFLAAQSSNAQFMARVLASKHHADRAHLVYGNVAAFLIGCGAALVAAALVSLRARTRPGPGPARAWTIAALLTLAVMALSYWMETERIWLFAVPWIAAIPAAAGPFHDRTLRLLVAVGCAQALVMEMLFFTLW
jgi:hypothetical protein